MRAPHVVTDSTIVCGRPKYHEILHEDGFPHGSVKHGDWMRYREADDSRCKAKAVPQVTRHGPLVHCDECGERFSSRTAAKQHWWVHIRELMPKTYTEIEHGTVRGYHAHRRRGEEACDECKKAWSLYTTGWRKQYENRSPKRGF